MDPASLDPRLREAGEDSIVVNRPTNPGGPNNLPTAEPSVESPLQQLQQPTGPSPVASTATFTPQTPTGHLPNPLHDDTPGALDATPHDPNDPKRPRACEACRGLKVKCEPDPANPDGPCKRCAKAGRSCVVTQPTRKRQKKTDSRVAELEKKIDALTASLQATRGAPGGHQAPSEDQNGYGNIPYGATARDWGAPPSQNLQSQYPIEHEKQPLATPMATAGQKRKFAETRESSSDAVKDEPTPQQASAEREPADIIDRGVISMEEAAALFARYTDDMALHLPAVVFPAGTTAEEIRKTKPILFLSIMSVASSETPRLQRLVVKEMMQTFAEKIIINGEKSLEMVQALLVSVIWYYPPEHFEELKFYQFVHLAAVMSIDIGLGRRKNNPKSRLIPYTWRDHPFRKQPLPDPTTIEARRTWLAAYFLASNVAMALHRPNLIRWQSFMTECMDLLESSPEAAPTDRFLCHLVWTHRLAEEVGIQFSMDDPSVFVNITEQKVQYALRGFERDLAKYSESIPKNEKRPSLILSFNVLNLYMHEIALQADKSTDDFRPAMNADALRDPIPGLSDTLTPSHISALSSCLTAIDGIFETFLSMDVHSIRCVPIFNFVRVAYAVVVLIKMYFSASNANSELGKVINKDHMKVAEYLDKLLNKFREVASSDKSRPASKFLVVLAMLRGWFQKQGQTKAPGDEQVDPSLAGQSSQNNNESKSSSKEQNNGTTSNQQQQHQTQSDLNPANTPLQLLSEIATGNGPSNNNQNPMSANPDPQSLQAWLRTAPQPPQPFMYDPTSTSGATVTTGPGAPGTMAGPGQPIIPWMGTFGTDLDYGSLGDGFEQAMGLTMTGFGGASPGDPTSYENSMRYMMQNDGMLGPMLEGFQGGFQYQF
ncbi:hypothetical protein F5B20DRAFT_490003 [Whalleya microplaca]|nr:hypothetical protein F5B20DRAFT_490003 [Whalleya microplaca]